MHLFQIPPDLLGEQDGTHALGGQVVEGEPPDDFLVDLLFLRPFSDAAIPEIFAL